MTLLECSLIRPLCGLYLLAFLLYWLGEFMKAIKSAKAQFKYSKKRKRLRLTRNYKRYNKLKKRM